MRWHCVQTSRTYEEKTRHITDLFEKTNVNVAYSLTNSVEAYKEKCPTFTYVGKETMHITKFFKITNIDVVLLRTTPQANFFRKKIFIPF
jgi:hypothetical protein